MWPEVGDADDGYAIYQLGWYLVVLSAVVLYIYIYPLGLVHLK